ncbi:hypothetical protein VM1G_08049 [Cytospora mali]|uniref:Rhodopsin domain-containing protein n=1 Tax=Cytospora mali TaxID=578113 RepID=A0A194W770_CYTMA|nr:hypothetical protein VM1G_08049 [Valsa mali]
MSIQHPLPHGGAMEIVISSVFLLFAILAVIARFYSRSLQRKPISVDDYLIIAGLVFTIATVGVGYALILNGGVGMHMADATTEQTVMALKLFVAAPLMWATSTVLIKLSILFFYISIFTMSNIRTAVYILITLVIALFTAVILESFLLCRPFAFTWDKTIPGGVCGSSTEAYLAIAIVNLVIDLAVVFLPMPILWRLQMPFAKKLAISAILALGLLICGLTAARIKSVVELDSLDFTYTVVPDLIFGALEVELGIVNACLPIMRPVGRKVFGSSSVFHQGWSKERKISKGSNDLRGSALIDTRKFNRMSNNSRPQDEVSPGKF